MHVLCLYYYVYVRTFPPYSMLRRILATSHVARGVIRIAAEAVVGRDGGSGRAGRASTSFKIIPCDRMNSCYKEITLFTLRLCDYLPNCLSFLHRRSYSGRFIAVG